VTASLESEALRLSGLPPPYDFLNDRELDGLELYRRRDELGLELEWFGLLPADATLLLTPPTPTASTDAWDSSRLLHTAHLETGGSRLDLEHAGGTIDWYSCKATSGTRQGTSLVESGSAIPV